MRKERERAKKGEGAKSCSEVGYRRKARPRNGGGWIDGKGGALGGISRMRGRSWRSSKLRPNAAALECLQELPRKSSADACFFLQSIKTPFISPPRVSVSRKSVTHV